MAKAATKAPTARCLWSGAGSGCRGATVTITGTPTAKFPSEESSSADQALGPVDRPAPEEDRAPLHRLRTLLLAGSVYLVLSIIVWWNVWTSHPTSTTTCGCGDSSLFTWFLEWPAFAITHGLNPLYSTAAGYPHGVNLLANTSVLAIGTVLAPITWTFGVVATLNVALTLAPFLSALAMFVLLRRWVSWTPAAFVGGLFYGFSPFILVSLDDAHLMLGMAVVPPLVVICLDELLLRQRRRPIGMGVLLGLLATLQFFIGTEMLVFMAITGVVGVALIAVYAALRRPVGFRRGVRHAIVGLSAAGITAVVLLAYPTWFALDGPAHFTGLVWPHFFPGYGGNTLKDFAIPPPPVSTGFFGPAMSRVVGGSQGPILSSQFFGIGTITVVVVGAIAWRRDRRLWLFGAIALVSAVLSLGASHRHFLPWQLVVHLPVFDNITPTRFVLITALAVAIMVGLIVDHCYVAVNRRRQAARDGIPMGNLWRWCPRWGAAAAGMIVAVVAVAPSARYLARSLPITTQAVALPTWFTTVAPHLGARQVLLVLPAPFAVAQSSMTWQAVDEMHYSMVGLGGPGGVLERAGPERAGQSVITNASFFFSPTQTITAANIVAVRQALVGWGVTMVVIPDQIRLPKYERIRSVTHAAALMTAATGELPRHQADAWVWTGIERARPSVTPTTTSMSNCTAGLSFHGAVAVHEATACVLATPHGP
jgi:hypothetical protein